MKSSLAALAVVGLALVGLWYAGGGTTAPPSAAAAGPPGVSDPVAHENLAVYFLRGPEAVADAHLVATLQEALDAGWAVVHETGDVNTLAVENRSADTELFVQEGDMIRGGRQDRVIATDMLLPPKSGVVPFPAHCVEQGRWAGRGGEAATHFNKSDQFAVGKGLRYANASGRQAEVWENVKKSQEQLSANLNVQVNAPESETSLQLALENTAVRAKVSEFEQTLRAAGEARGDVIGVVFVINGQVTGAEVYGSNALFRKAWPKLLRSAAADAVAEKSDTPPPPPTAAEVERLLARAGRGPAAAREQGVPPGGELANEDIGFVTNGTRNTVLPVVAMGPPGTEFRGRSGSTRNRSVDGGGAPNPSDPAAALPLLPNTTNAARGGAATGGEIAGPPTGQQLRQLTETWSNLPPGNRRQAVEEQIRQLPPRYRALVEEYFRYLEHGRQRAAAAPIPLPAPQAAATPVNPQGNRLNVNRVEDRAGLVSESRDPARQNAVIHRSLIKK